MDSDIKYIIEEEHKLLLMAEDSQKAASERVEAARNQTAIVRESEFNRITAEYKIMSEKKLQEIKRQVENELKEMKIVQQHLFEDEDLKNKITGRIVSVILENRT